jgi:hypothetical protein
LIGETQQIKVTLLYQILAEDDDQVQVAVSIDLNKFDPGQFCDTGEYFASCHSVNSPNTPSMSIS